ncbi:MAG: NUDIX hydrolase [Ketobacteraceae bacterium]|nr:NUDIX hydrolase [Ketobacteraceae bacterium]
MTWKPNATVATIVEDNGKFLMVEEISDGQLVVNQPAGHIEEGESILAAALRETLEETGYHVNLGELIGVYTLKALNGNIYYRFCFSATLSHRDENATIDPDIQNVVWLSKQEIAHEDHRHRSPLVQVCLNDYLAGKRYPLSLIYEHPTT